MTLTINQQEKRAEKRSVMNTLMELNPKVSFGTFSIADDYLEWCGSVNGSSLKLPEGWRYSKAKGRIIGPQFRFYYWKEYRYQKQA